MSPGREPALETSRERNDCAGRASEWLEAP